MAVDSAFNYHLNVFNNVEVNVSNTALTNVVSGEGTRTYTNSINYGNLVSTIGSAFNRFNSVLNRNRVVLSVTRFDGATVRDELTRFSLATEVTGTNSFSISVIFLFIQVIAYNGYRVLAIRFSIICYDIDSIESSKKYSAESTNFAVFNVLSSTQSHSMRK
jgi:hypothetical protein